jgi:hypothetical protein
MAFIPEGDIASSCVFPVSGAASLSVSKGSEELVEPTEGEENVGTIGIGADEDEGVSGLLFDSGV